MIHTYDYFNEIFSHVNQIGIQLCECSRVFVFPVPIFIRNVYRYNLAPVQRPLNSTHIFELASCIVLCVYRTQISGERLQSQWSVNVILSPQSKISHCIFGNKPSQISIKNYTFPLNILYQIVYVVCRFKFALVNNNGCQRDAVAQW